MGTQCPASRREPRAAEFVFTHPRAQGWACADAASSVMSPGPSRHLWAPRAVHCSSVCCPGATRTPYHPLPVSGVFLFHQVVSPEGTGACRGLAGSLELGSLLPEQCPTLCPWRRELTWTQPLASLSEGAQAEAVAATQVPPKNSCWLPPVQQQRLGLLSLPVDAWKLCCRDHGLSLIHI